MLETGGLERQGRLDGKALPVVFILADDIPEARGRSLTAGPLGFLRKPFSPGQRMDRVHAAKRRAAP